MVTTEQDVDTRPVVHDARMSYGVADAVQVVVQVGYPGESPRHVTFAGSLHGGPVVMVTGFGSHFVDQNVRDRCGERLNVEWVMRFFGQQDQPKPRHPEDICGKCGNCERNFCDSHELCYCGQ